MYLSVRSGGVIWTLREGGVQSPNHKNKLFSLVKTKELQIYMFLQMSPMSAFCKTLAMVLMQKLGICTLKANRFLPIFHDVHKLVI